MNPVEIPAYIDDPPHFLFWRADEIAPVLLGLVLGMLTANALLLTTLGLLLTRLYRRFRDGKPDGYILHALYHIGLLPSRARSVPNPFIRQYLP